MHFWSQNKKLTGRRRKKRKEKKRKKKKRKEGSKSKVWMLAFGMELVIFIWNYMVLYGFLV